MKFYNLISIAWTIVGVGLFIYGFTLEPNLRFWPIAKMVGAFLTFTGLFNVVYAVIVNRKK